MSVNVDDTSELERVRRRDKEMLEKLDGFMDDTQMWTGEELLELLEDLRLELRRTVTG